MKNNKKEILKQIEKKFLKYCEIKTKNWIGIYEYCFELSPNTYLCLSIRSSCRLFKRNYVIAINESFPPYFEKKDLDSTDWDFEREYKHEYIKLEAEKYKSFSELIGLKVLEVSIEDDMIWIYFEENYKLNIFSNIDFEIKQPTPEFMQVII